MVSPWDKLLGFFIGTNLETSVDKHVITCYNMVEVKERRHIKCGDDEKPARHSKGLVRNLGLRAHSLATGKAQRQEKKQAQGAEMTASPFFWGMLHYTTLKMKNEQKRNQCFIGGPCRPKRLGWGFFPTRHSGHHETGPHRHLFHFEQQEGQRC